MSRWLLPLTVLGCAAVTVPGCFHTNQDCVVSGVAAELASLPRDQHTQAVVSTPKPRPEVKPVPPGKGPPELLRLPPELPGVEAPPLVVPPLDPKNLNDPQRAKAIQKLFPELPEVGPDPVPGLTPDGRPLDLPALQEMALAQNPLVQQAAADAQAARGAAIQAGLYPNPNVGFQGDSIGQAGTKGSLGGFFEQTIKTANKLGLARAAGEVDVRNAELTLRKTQIDVMTQVRTGYFA